MRSDPPARVGYPFSAVALTNVLVAEQRGQTKEKPLAWGRATLYPLGEATHEAAMYKSRAVTEIVGIPSATLRDWRSQGKDFEGVWGEDRRKDHTYTRRGLLSLAIMKEVRASGGSIEEAWQTAFWAVDEVARWLDVWNIEGWPGTEHHKHKLTTHARWCILTDGTPIVTDDASLAGDVEHDSCLVRLVDLKRLADGLPRKLVSELRIAE